jgi:hypothetical protein
MWMRRRGSLHEEELGRMGLTEVGNASGILCEIRRGGGDFQVIDGGWEVGEGGGDAHVVVCGREQGKKERGAGRGGRWLFKQLGGTG